MTSTTHTSVSSASSTLVASICHRSLAISRSNRLAAFWRRGGRAATSPLRTST